MKMEEKNRIAAEFAIKIAAHLQTMFDESEETEFFIDLEEISKDDTATELIHAVANLVPSMFYEKLTGQKTDTLGFNHIANRLAFQFSKSK